MWRKQNWIKINLCCVTLNKCHDVAFIWCPTLPSVLNQTWNVSTIFCETLKYQTFKDVKCRQTGGHATANRQTFTTNLKYSSNLTVNTLPLHYKDQLANAANRIIVAYSNIRNTQIHSEGGMFWSTLIYTATGRIRRQVKQLSTIQAYTAFTLLTIWCVVNMQLRYCNKNKLYK